MHWRSVALPELANGVWHHLTVIIQAAVRTEKDIKSYVSVLMDGASTKIEVECADEDPRTAFAALGWTNPANGQLIAGAPKMGKGVHVDSLRDRLGRPPKAFDALERKGDMAGTGKKPFLYRDTRDTVDLYAVLVVGATYDTVSDSFIRPLSAFVDSVAYYDRALSTDEVATLATEMPCARGAEGDGFVFFPGLSAASHRGPEQLKFQGIKCRPGPHTVRFRYLLAQGNGRRASVELSTTTESPTVDFAEPPGFDRDAVDKWYGYVINFVRRVFLLTIIKSFNTIPFSSFFFFLPIFFFFWHESCVSIATLTRGENLPWRSSMFPRLTIAARRLPPWTSPSLPQGRRRQLLQRVPRLPRVSSHGRLNAATDEVCCRAPWKMNRPWMSKGLRTPVRFRSTPWNSADGSVAASVPQQRKGSARHRRRHRRRRCLSDLRGDGLECAWRRGT